MTANPSPTAPSTAVTHASARAAGEGIDLAWLLDGRAGVPHVAVRELTLDSRAVKAGDAFVALRGLKAHGLDHAAEAAERGATVVLFDPAEGRDAPSLPLGAIAVRVPELRAQLGGLADRFYGSPSSQLEVAGVTGTNGKTTCAWLLAQAYGPVGAYVGTLGAGRTGAVAAGTHTTPDVISVHRLLRDLRDGGARRVAMEVSSHALDQQRVAAVRMPVAGFTNLSRDHLDYHGTMAAYGAAKERIFACRGVTHAVVNVGDAYGRELAGRLPSGVRLTVVHAGDVTVSAERWVVARDVRCVPHGLELEGDTHEGAFALRSPLIGGFNAENLVVVLGMLLAGGMPLAAALDALQVATAPPGRMESFPLPSGAVVVVDYAHTPDALDKALIALRSHCAGRLWCVFGCGGERDPGKRPQMAAIAEARSDAIVVTDDNPRGEDPERIVAQILGGLAGRVPAQVERDRGAAIRLAARSARAGDVVLVAGKGHEDYQLVGNERRAWSDRDAARRLQEEVA
jgi:UDP-N-acetylmuramoyl-L-alanyl-D-glutamate--2,6-diaminopimelate ligase